MEIIIKDTSMIVHRNGMIERRDQRNNKIVPFKITDNKYGYLCIRVDWKKFPIHRLMAIAYLELPLNDITREIIHINHNLKDNDITNLKLV
jgi:hypothetical protein